MWWRWRWRGCIVLAVISLAVTRLWRAVATDGRRVLVLVLEPGMLLFCWSCLPLVGSEQGCSWGVVVAAVVAAVALGLLRGWLLLGSLGCWRCYPSYCYPSTSILSPCHFPTAQEWRIRSSSK